MNILYLSAATAVGGGNKSLIGLCQGMQSEGHRVLVSIPGPGEMASQCSQAGIDHVLTPFVQPAWRHPLQSWRAMSQWNAIFRSFKPDLIHANELLPARSILLASRRARLPLICHVRCAPKRQLINWVFRGLTKPNTFVFNSHALQDAVGGWLEASCPNSDQVVIHNAVDVEQFCPPGEKKNGKPVVGIIANLLPVKGHRDFLEMAKLLRDRQHDCEFWIIGGEVDKSGYAATLEQLSASLGLESHVHFLGFRDQVVELIQQLDVVVCCSHMEAFGRCIVEAMSCAKAVVATNVGGLPEVVGDDGTSGILVPPHSPTRLADAVEELLLNPKTRNQLGKAGRERAQRLYSLPSHISRTIELYKSTTSRVLHRQLAAATP